MATSVTPIEIGSLNKQSIILGVELTTKHFRWASEQVFLLTGMCLRANIKAGWERNSETDTKISDWLIQVYFKQSADLWLRASVGVFEVKLPSSQPIKKERTRDTA